MPIENRPHIFRCVIEITGKLDLAITNAGNLSQRAFEILLHFATHRIKLYANLFDLVVFDAPAKSPGQHGSGRDCTQKASAVHDQSSPRFINPTAWSQARAVSAI